MMDKKIILSVLIVALIGIVAATYQITPGQDILNPLASVETEDTPVTEVLTAPDESQQQAQDQANAEAQKQAQAEAQAQQAKDQAKAQAEAEAKAQNPQQDSSSAGSASPSAIVNSENPVTISSSATGSGSSSSDSNSGDSASGNSGSSDSGSSGSTDASSTGDSSTGDSSSAGTSGNGEGTTPATDGNAPTDSQSSTSGTTVDDGVWSEIDSVVQNAQNNFAFGIYADRDSCSVDENGLYSVNVYKSESDELIGRLYINIDKNSDEYGQWYLIDVNGDPQGPDVSEP